MTEDKFLEEVTRLVEENTADAYKKIIELIDNYEDNKKYKSLRNRCEIRVLELELANIEENDKKNRIHLTGKLIKLYKKQISLEEKNNDKLAARHQMLELQKKQKELTKDYKKSNSYLSIFEKVALTVKDIANTIEIFINEKDLITKAKNVLIETTSGTVETTAFMAVLALIAPLYGGVGLSLSIIAKALPVASYIGLTSVVRNCLSKTEFQQFEYYQSDEYKAYIEKFKEENKTLLEEFNNLLNEKSSCNTTDEKIAINESLITKLDEIASKIKDTGLKRTYQLQAYGFMKENKKLCQNEIDRYLDGLSDDKEKHKKYQDKKASINIELFHRGNSIEEAIKQAGKTAGISLTATVVAKALMTLVAPGSTYSIKSIKSFVLPLFLALTNGVTTVMSYSGKLKYLDTEEEQEIKAKDKEKFEELFGSLKIQAAY